MGFKRLGVLRYVDSGYAVVSQQIRGVGAIGGRFVFSAPQERSDGFDSVEWAAAQPWCTGAVGMPRACQTICTSSARQLDFDPQPACRRCLQANAASVKAGELVHDREAQSAAGHRLVQSRAPSHHGLASV